MVSLGALLADAERGGGVLEIPVYEEWLQGRTAYGGLVMAAAYRAARGLEPGLPPLRSAQIAFAGPVMRAAIVRSRMLRRGRSSAFVEARIESQGEAAMVALFLFCAERASAIDLTAPPAGEVPPPETAEPAMRRVVSGFASQFEYRHGIGRAARGTPELQRWVRLREREGLDAVTELLAIGDALPSGAAPLLAEPAPISTATWTANLLDAAPMTEEGWWLARTKADSATGGISSQTMTVWNRSGAAVLHGMQQVLIYG